MPSCVHSAVGLILYNMQ